MVRSVKRGKVVKGTKNHYEVRPRTGIMSGFGESMVQGMAFGAGSVLAHRVLGPKRVEVEHKREELCSKELQIYRECSQNTSFDCGIYFEKYKKCIDKHFGNA
mgnify:CR=1 FL=1